MEQELISKKDLLAKYGISYGALYRWKRMGLIPEDWFLKKAAVTGQETFFPRGLICERVELILGKKDVSLEELAADFVQHTMQENAQKADDTIMDIKLFSDSDSLKIVIRNAASRYNPLEFDLDDETFAKVGVKLVQKICRRIEYNYVYRMNIVTIDVDK